MSIKLKGSTDGSVTLQAPADTSPTGTDKTFTLPTQDGDAGQILKTNGSGALSFTDNLASNRNLIINGAMRVAQRATSKTGLQNGDTGYYTVDRFQWLEQGNPTYVQTMSQSTDAPDGFSNSLKVETTTADTAYPGSESNGIVYKVEGYDLQSLAYGTSSAKDFTLSFWVKSNVTGTYVIWLYNSDVVMSCTQSYTIDTANTWEYKTVTVAGSTSNAIDNDNGSGLDIRWILGTGPGFSSGTASTTWVDSIANANRYVGQTANIPGTVGNTWQITGVQLEVGNVATAFEHRSYGDDLEKCRRYYQKFKAGDPYTFYGAAVAYNADQLRLNFPLSPEMRAKPTALEVSAGTDFLAEKQAGTVLSTTTAVMSTNVSSNRAVIVFDSATNFDTGGVGYNVYSDNNSSAFAAFYAEL